MDIKKISEDNSRQVLIKGDETALLVVDLQQKLVPLIQNKSSLIKLVIKLIKAIRIFKIKSFYTEQNPNRLGETLEEIKNELNDSAYTKMSFSCCECESLLSKFNENNIRNIIICGIESHICVLQTAIELIAKGFNVIITIDAIGGRNNIDHETVIIRISNIGATITTVESIIFELCKTADHPEFKLISKLIKDK